MNNNSFTRFGQSNTSNGPRSVFGSSSVNSNVFNNSNLGSSSAFPSTNQQNAHNQGETTSAKSEANTPSISEEQRLRIERNKQQALERLKQKQQSTSNQESNSIQIHNDSSHALSPPKNTVEAKSASVSPTSSPPFTVQNQFSRNTTPNVVKPLQQRTIPFVPTQKNWANVNNNVVASSNQQNPPSQKPNDIYGQTSTSFVNPLEKSRFESATKVLNTEYDFDLDMSVDEPIPDNNIDIATLATELVAPSPTVTPPTTPTKPRPYNKPTVSSPYFAKSHPPPSPMQEVTQAPNASKGRAPLKRKASDLANQQSTIASFFSSAQPSNTNTADDDDVPMFQQIGTQSNTPSRINAAPTQASQASPAPRVPFTKRRLSNSAEKANSQPDAMDQTEPVAAPVTPTRTYAPATPQPNSVLKQFARSQQPASPSNTPPATPVKKPPSTPSNGFSLKSPMREPVEEPATGGKKEDRFKWLVDIQDAKKRRPDHPQYDPSTLWIPQEEFSKLTPAKKQYWEIKRRYFDTVIFFQQGSFYNVFERDADICHKHLGWNYTHGANRPVNNYTAGVSIGGDTWLKYAYQLIELGSFKVACVKQVETTSKKSASDASPAKKKSKKAMSAETPNSSMNSANPILSSLSTIGDTEDRVIDCILTKGTIVDEAHLPVTSNYLLTIKEDGDDMAYVLLDASLAEFNVGRFKDDKYRSSFETLLLQTKPKEVVYERGQLGAQSMHLIKRILNAPILNSLAPREQFWDSQTTKDHIMDNAYWGRSLEEWPPLMKKYSDDAVMMSALGGCIFYLQKLQMDRALLSHKNVKEFNVQTQSSTMILGGQVLKNLEILENNSGGAEGTLLTLLDHCNTPFGKRMIRRWLCHPLFKVAEIELRQDAVSDLLKNREIDDALSVPLKQLPDLERKISRLHIGAVNVETFLQIVDGFHRMLVCHSVTSKRLHDLTTVGKKFPDVKKVLDFFRDAIDKDRSSRTELVPHEGFNEEYDNNIKKIRAIENQLQQHLQQEAKKLGVSGLKYVSDGKLGEYTLEVSRKVLTKDLPDSYRTKELKNAIRFVTPMRSKLVMELEEAQSSVQHVTKTLLSQFVDEFDRHYFEFLQSIECIAELDCLLSLAKMCSGLGMLVTKPKFIPYEKHTRPSLNIKQMVHPCLVHRIRGGEYIPNDITMGNEDPALIVLTGPNMGGKSTLLRTTCVIVILAQIGCFVPAQECSLTPVDRIFSRVGANDNIMNNESTFMVELHETQSILSYATNRSLIILDELGRGTSTFDGYAIAYAVLSHFANLQMPPRMLFATHYHLLSEEFKIHPHVAMYQMSSVMHEGKLVFTYTMEAGVCPKSYGMNVASLAGIPEEIITKAEQIAEEFEARSNMSLANKKPVGEAVLTSQVQTAKSVNYLSFLSPHEKNSLKSVMIKSLTVNDYNMMQDVWKTLNMCVAFDQSEE